MTSNGFDFFEGARTETKAPQITVRRSGQMVLTSAAVALLGDGVTHVQFGFDTKTGAVALRAATEETKGHYRLREQANGSSLVDGRRFLGHHGLKLDKAQRFSAEAFGDGMVGFHLPEGVAASDGRPGEDRPRARTRPPRARPPGPPSRRPPPPHDHDPGGPGDVLPER